MSLTTKTFLFPEDVWTLIKEFIFEDTSIIFDFIEKFHYFPNTSSNTLRLKTSLFYQIKTQFARFISLWMEEEIKRTSIFLAPTYRPLGQVLLGDVFEKKRDALRKQIADYICMTTDEKFSHRRDGDILWKDMKNISWPRELFLGQLCMQRTQRHNKRNRQTFQGYILFDEPYNLDRIESVKRYLKPCREIHECIVNGKSYLYVFAPMPSTTNAYHFQTDCGDELRDPPISGAIFEDTLTMNYIARYHLFLEGCCDDLYGTYPYPSAFSTSLRLFL